MIIIGHDNYMTEIEFITIKVIDEEVTNYYDKMYKMMSKQFLKLEPYDFENMNYIIFKK